MNNKEEKGIDLLELGKKLWENKKFIIKCSIVGVILGVVIAFSIPKEYTTTVVLITESNSTTGGGMSALASMAGINLNANSSEDIFSPELYPEVLKSTPFVQGFLDVVVIDESQGINTTLYDYLEKEQQESWWTYIIKFPAAIIQMIAGSKNEEDLATKSHRYISGEDQKIIENLTQAYTINTDKKTGITTIEVTAQSSIISAYLADTLTSYLQSYIISQRTKKAATDLNNSKELFAQTQTEYYRAQSELAKFVDQNHGLSQAKHVVHKDRLQSEVSLTFSVYNQMAQQVQVNMIKVQDNTPVFTIIQPPIEPLVPSSPKKKIILLGFIILSITVASIWSIKNDLLSILKHELKINDEQ